MKVYDALLVEGTSNFCILCYGIFSASELDFAVDTFGQQYSSEGSHFYKFLDEGWPNGLLLCETLVTREEDIPGIITRVLLRNFEVAQCRGAICLYDGAFSTYDDIFSDSVASQTYGFCFRDSQTVVALDANLLASEEWRSVIRHSRRRLSEF